MRRRFTVHRVAPGHAPSNRLAWWAAFVSTLALIALLSAVRADAAPVPRGGPATPQPAAAEPEEEAEDTLAEEEAGLEEFEECGDEEEVEECLEEVAEASSGTPSGCGLVRAEARLTLNPTGTMRLTIRYITDAPTTVAIDYRSRGPKGSLRFAGTRGHLTGTGTLHETEHLSRHQTAQAIAARTFTIGLRPIGPPAGCAQQLTVKRTTRRAVWLG